MRWLLKFTLTLTALGALPALGTTPECIPAEEMTALMSPFNNMGQYHGREYCFQDENRDLIRALRILKNTEFPSHMPPSGDGLYVGDIFKGGWWKYFTERIDWIDVLGKTCERSVMAYVNHGSKTVHICSSQEGNSVRPIDIAIRLLHEARHLDGYEHDHVPTCERGDLKGRSRVCDQRLSDRGAWAATIEGYAQYIMYAKNIEPEAKAYARKRLRIDLDGFFNESSKALWEDALLVLTQNQRLHVGRWNQNAQKMELTDIGSTPYPTKKLIPQDHGYYPLPSKLGQKMKMAWYNGSSEENEKLVFDSEMMGGLHNYYETFTERENKNWSDVFYSEDWYVRVYDSNLMVVCDQKKGSERREAKGTFKPAKAIGFMFPDGYAERAPIAELLINSGETLEVGCDQNRKPFMRKANRDLVSSGISRQFYFGRAGMMSVLSDGRLMVSTDYSEDVLRTELDGQIIDAIPFKYNHALDNPLLRAERAPVPVSAPRAPSIPQNHKLFQDRLTEDGENVGPGPDAIEEGVNESVWHQTPRSEKPRLRIRLPNRNK